MGLATLIVTNARVLTMDDDNPRAEAIALQGERILALGDTATILSLAGGGCQVIDAGGATVLPGFIESHLHLFMGGNELAHLQLLGVEGPEALTEALTAYASANPDAVMLMGQGCDYAIYGRSLTRHDIDAIVADRPVLFTAADHHTAWANTKALEMAGILQGRSLGTGNEIVMGEDGLATGELREFEAFSPVLKLTGQDRINAGIATGEEPVPTPSHDDLMADLEPMERGLQHCAKQGFTSLVNMDGNRYTLLVLSELRRQGRLTARVRVPFHYRPHRQVADLAGATSLSDEFRDDWLSSGFVKLFMDGVVDSETAAMIHDYPDSPGWKGDPLHTAERFNEIAIEADRRGLQIAVHAIGDGAVRRVLDGYEAAQAANGKRDARHRIEHIELIDRADVPRLAALGVTASIQPVHAPGAMDFPVFPTMNKLAKHRWKDAYLCRELAEAGAHLAFASDWPVADINPFRGIQAAMTRPTYEGANDQSLDLMAALKGYTIGGAYAEHTEDRKGMLKPGYLADLVILSGDIEATAPEEIGTMSAAKTICGGRVVWEGAA
ncbi:amidohydrolase [Pararhodobacter sp. CCB-MM2]|uniref:amidohydrolase n=1 Tax=Pararhodobacter sp. CCB-MM2 TaxID=1786003 RepID=UPI000832885B|nr:amidohydrolase [Pararhodobacter sp. CCB-MM2]